LGGTRKAESRCRFRRACSETTRGTIRGRGGDLDLKDRMKEGYPRQMSELILSLIEKLNASLVLGKNGEKKHRASTFRLGDPGKGWRISSG